MVQLPTDLIETLRSRFTENKLHHALLLAGKSVEITDRASLQLARHILGMDEERDEHPDLFHLRPSGKARIINVEKTRELISQLHRSSNQGGAKVAIVHEADRMRKESANAFLKTLEEPPSGTYLLMLSTRPYSLLATIRSRCLLARLSGSAESTTGDNWNSWSESYRAWIHALLDREKLRKDRISPLFAAYGLTASLLSLINQQADERYQQAKEGMSLLDDKERDAMEVGIRKGARSAILGQLSEITREIAVERMKTDDASKIGNKLTRVIQSLERSVGLLEVNFKDEAALEDFHLSSLRIWSSQ